MDRGDFTELAATVAAMAGGAAYVLGFSWPAVAMVVVLVIVVAELSWRLP